MEMPEAIDQEASNALVKETTPTADEIARRIDAERARLRIGVTEMAIEYFGYTPKLLRLPRTRIRLGEDLGDLSLGANWMP